ncbi:MAG: P-loop NTPase [Planctomycetota bacterium]
MESQFPVENRKNGLLHRLLSRSGYLPSEPRRREAAVVAFASGKGGTGKSFLTTNLAIALHQRGRRVVVVDCDFGLANSHLLFGANPPFSMQHLLNGQRTVREVLIETSFGPSLIAGGSGVVSMAELGSRHMQMLARSLGHLAQSFDVVLLDCAAGMAPQSMITVLGAKRVVMVTNPEIAALTDAYAVIKCLARQVERPPVDLLVNRATSPELASATFDRLFEVSRRFAHQPIHYLGAVPEDPSVSLRRLGKPPMLVGDPECETTMALQILADRLDERVAPANEGERQRGVEQRMLAQIRRW